MTFEVKYHIQSAGSQSGKRLQMGDMSISNVKGPGTQGQTKLLPPEKNDG